MPISSAVYEICLANSIWEGGFTLVITWSPEKNGIVLEVRVTRLCKIRGYVIDKIIGYDSLPCCTLRHFYESLSSD